MTKQILKQSLLEENRLIRMLLHVIVADLFYKRPVSLIHPDNRATNKSFPSQEAKNNKDQ